MAVGESVDERVLGVVEVRNRLRRAVLQTQLLPGTLYSQDEVRKSLDVGRTPFREALRMVQAENLVELLPNGRLKIPELSMEDFTQLQIARIALETAAVRLSIPKLSPDDLAHLEGYMAQMSHYLGSDLFERVEAPHSEFHRALVAGAGCSVLAMITDLSDRVGRYRWTFAAQLQPYWSERTAEHRAVLDAAKAGESEEVVAQLVRHYVKTGLLLADTMEESGGASDRDRFEERTLASLAPSVHKAVSALK